MGQSLSLTAEARRHEAKLDKLAKRNDAHFGTRCRNCWIDCGDQGNSVAVRNRVARDLVAAGFGSLIPGKCAR